jgi:REP element-mobilizing transposase RayT
MKFGRDRDAYRQRLREALPQFDISLLDYCLTSNHVHLLIDAATRREVECGKDPTLDPFAPRD